MRAKLTSAREFLIIDYEERLKKNRRFSKRSYAAFLGISIGRLVEILNGRSPITEKRASKIIDKLLLSENERRTFLHLVENENIDRTGQRKKTLLIEKRLRIEEFTPISDWEYFAIMALIETKSFQPEADWISRKLDIQISRADEVLKNLKDLDYVRLDESGRYKNNYKALTTLTNVPSEILKKANRECILQGIEKMESVDVALREITSMTFPMDMSKMKKAKSLIEKFRREMSTLCETENATEVYNLNVQLIPISTPDV